MTIRTAILGATIACAMAGCSHDNPPAKAPEPIASAPASTPKEQATTETVGVHASKRMQIACNLPDSRDSAPLFDFDQAQLRYRGKSILDSVATCLKEGELKGQQIQAIGFADPRGTQEYNMALGTYRAEAARNYLLSDGLSASRVQVASCGEHEAIGTDEATWAGDRRVELALADETLPSPQCEGQSPSDTSSPNARTMSMK